MSTCWNADSLSTLYTKKSEEHRHTIVCVCVRENREEDRILVSFPSFFLTKLNLNSNGGRTIAHSLVFSGTNDFAKYHYCKGTLHSISMSPTTQFYEQNRKFCMMVRKSKSIYRVDPSWIVNDESCESESSALTEL